MPKEGIWFFKIIVVDGKEIPELTPVPPGTTLVDIPID